MQLLVPCRQLFHINFKLTNILSTFYTPKAIMRIFIHHINGSSSDKINTKLYNKNTKK